MMHAPIRIPFLSEGNSLRSQIAEALLRHWGGERFEVHSAGRDTAPDRRLAPSPGRRRMRAGGGSSAYAF